MRDFINGLLRSKTIIFAMALAVLGVIESNLQLLAPFMSSQNFGLFSIIVGAIIAALRVNTTDSLSHKGDDERTSRVDDKGPP